MFYHAPTLRSEVRSVQCERRRNRQTHRKREDEERVRRRLTVAGPRGSRGEEGGAQEARGSGACHQPRAVLGEQQDGTVRSSVACERRRARSRPAGRFEQRPNRRRAIAPCRRCPTTTLPTTTTTHHLCSLTHRTTNTLKGEYSLESTQEIR